MIHDDPLSFEQEPKPPIAEPASLAGQCSQPLPDLRSVCRRRASHGLRIDLDQPAGTTLRIAVLRDQAKRRRPACRRRSQFFARSPFNADTASSASASNFFSRRFSSSSVLKR